MTKKVLFALDAVGEEDIWTQVLKSSDETCKLPEHVEFEVLVVMVEVVSFLQKRLRNCCRFVLE